MSTGRDPYVSREADVQGPARTLVVRWSIAAAATVLVLGAIGSCVQAPPAEDAIGVPRNVVPTASPYRPDAMPTDLPDAVVSSDDISVDPVSGEGPPDLPVTAPAQTQGSATTTRPATQGTAAVPATAAAPQTTSAPVAETTQAAAPATQAPAPATTAAKVQTTAAATQGSTTAALVGPGKVDISCIAISGGKSKAILTWQNKGFIASIVVNGHTFKQTSTTSTNFSATASETVSGHGYCTGTVEGQTATKSY